MRGKGISFDTGFLSAGTSTREPFDPEVVRLTGSELSLFAVGLLPGETLEERLALVADPLRVRPMIGEVRARINDFLRKAVEVVRARFRGKVSYASLPLEGVDGAPFAVISTDAAYRTAA